MTVRADCTAFLQWCLPRLQMRWPGFRKVRAQVCKRVARRYRQLGLDSFDQYRRYLEGDDREWPVLDGLCRVTISRFYRDREVFEMLESTVLPELASAAGTEVQPIVRVWSCGCASGEEPYTLAMAWRYELAPGFPDVAFEITATDADPEMLDRARRARYPTASVRDLPDTWHRLGLTASGEEVQLDPEIMGMVEWRREDVRQSIPAADFDLVLCRNLVFTYYTEKLQRRILTNLAASIRPGGALVIGGHEALPEPQENFEPWDAARSVFRRINR